jgi:hypothetical protein
LISTSPPFTTAPAAGLVIFTWLPSSVAAQTLTLDPNANKPTAANTAPTRLIATLLIMKEVLKY